jgi:hypothetical protein
MFEIVHVINMDSSRDRLQKLDQNFRKYGITYERFNAINGKTLDKQIIDARVHSLCKTLTCSKGFIGASMSHIQLWKEIATLSQDDQWHLILEDDVQIASDTFSKAEIVKKFVKTIDKLQPTVINLSPFSLFEASNVNITRVSYMSGLSAYLINASGAKLLTEYYSNNKLRFIIDLDMSGVPGLFKYSTSAQVIQTSFDINDAINKTNSYSIPLMQSIFVAVFPKSFSDKLNFLLNGSCLHLFTKITIPNGYILLTIMFIVGWLLKSSLLCIYVFSELLLSIILWCYGKLL